MVALLTLLATRRRATRDEIDHITCDYGQLLLPVEPISLPGGHPTVDVAEFPALAQLAERYATFILHWTRADIHTFIVQDDGITYRYRTTTGDREPHPSKTPTLV